MASAMLKRLREALERIEAERARIDKQAEAFKQVIAYFETIEEEDEAPARVSPAKAITNEMWRILEEAREPLHYQLIYERLKERGVAVPGKEPARNVGAHLSNDPRFENVGRGLWGLRSWSARPTSVRAEPPNVAMLGFADSLSSAPPVEEQDDSDDQPATDDLRRLFASLGAVPPE